MKSMLENVATSYDDGFQSIDSLLNTNPQILQSFQESLFDVRQEREKIHIELRDFLAKNDSLRKKDFDRMMHGILAAQTEKEKEIRDCVNSYLVEQREMINFLRENLNKIKEAIAKGEPIKVKESQAFIRDVLSQQDKRKESVTSELKEFQKDQREMTVKLVHLLSKGRELRIKDLKIMLKEFEIERQQRLEERQARIKEVQERKEGVQQMLDEFKKKRTNSAGEVLQVK